MGSLAKLRGFIRKDLLGAIATRVPNVLSRSPRKLAIAQKSGRGYLVGNEETDRPGSLRSSSAYQLLEESRLGRCFIGIVKIAQADANQAKPLVRAEADTF